VILLAALVSCQRGPQRSPAIGSAYVGPAALKLRGDIPLQSPVVATVKHGEKLEIVQRRRRFYRVRTSSGVEGWTDERQLLAADDMQKLKDLAAEAAKLPAQGQATTFGELNVHTQPSRQSPSFLQVKENEKVDVLRHIAAPRAELTRTPLIPPAPKQVKQVPKKPPKEPKYPPLAVPQPPPPPPNWLELSKTDLNAAEAGPDDAAEEKPEKEEKEEKPIPTDDWSLIRTKSGETGWALTRRLVMAIPDEVAQYAEGKRIVSYFAIGEIQDDDQKKHNWLWTTVSDGVYPYDFDSFRVFIWSLRRHRYETAYIERNIRGYAPVFVHDVELNTTAAKGTTETAKFPGFSICVDKKDGSHMRRDYAFLTNVVRFAGEQPCGAASPVPTVTAQAPLPASAGEQPASESFSQRVRKRMRSLTRGLFGG
jgi:hypothetical protein